MQCAELLRIIFVFDTEASSVAMSYGSLNGGMSTGC